MIAHNLAVKHCMYFSYVFSFNHTITLSVTYTYVTRCKAYKKYAIFTDTSITILHFINFYTAKPLIFLFNRCKVTTNYLFDKYFAKKFNTKKMVSNPGTILEIRFLNCLTLKDSRMSRNIVSKPHVTTHNSVMSYSHTPKDRRV